MIVNTSHSRRLVALRLSLNRAPRFEFLQGRGQEQLTVAAVTSALASCDAKWLHVRCLVADWHVLQLYWTTSK
eukprot:3554183-Amphidinium_carterae.1